MIKIQKLKILFLLPIFYFLFTFSAKAAELNLTSQTQTIGVGQQFQVDLALDTKGEDINAVEGKIIFPADLLEIKKINDGNSIINFWIDPVKNCVSNGVKKPDEICFSGIVPGGYNDSKGLIFSITFLAKKEGSGAIKFSGVKVLRNDGKGTPVDVKISNFQFAIKEVGLPKELPEIKDTEPPEDFKPEIAQSPEIFDGKYFLVFATQDKMSGIANYKMREGEWGWFRIAESPYLLKDQDLKSFIYVKAIDKSGNERIAAVKPKYPIKWYESMWIWSIIIAIGMIVAYLGRKILWLKKSK
ncbi:MAG: cohesin domain-containing protein [bacterium]|nr:cohesin domain-containing protein [bacterium]